MTAKLNQCKDKIARANNFDSFRRAIRYTFNRALLPSEDEFINKIIDEAMEEYADIKAKKAWESKPEIKIYDKINRRESRINFFIDKNGLVWADENPSGIDMSGRVRIKPLALDDKRFEIRKITYEQWKEQESK